MLTGTEIISISKNGCLSILGVPGIGDDIYAGFPHNTPDYLNHSQGFTLLTHISGEWFPQVIRIIRGTAYWGKKLYVSRVKKSVQIPHNG